MARGTGKVSLGSKPLKRGKSKGPHLIIEEFRRKNKRSMGYTEWNDTVCSECHQSLHETARFCVHCGAWFGDNKPEKE